MIKKIYYILLQRLYVLFEKINAILSRKDNNQKVLMFHKLSSCYEDDIYTVNVNNFEKLIKCFYKKDLVKRIERFKEKKSIIITFDDAYDSVYYYARPILKENKIPYYVFLCNELIDTKGYLKTYQIKEMIDDGNCVIGSHLYRHKLSRFVEQEHLEKMVLESKKELEENFKVKINCFAFPYGSFYAVSKKNIQLAKKHFDYIFTTLPLNYDKKYLNVYPRFNMNDKEIRRWQK